jgi:hypothetical protein
MDWTDARLRKWVEDDLSSAAGATWKFVCFHQPGFSADAKHWREQRMRLVADILQRHHVDVVFSGHHHAYERSFPLRFALERQPDGSMIAEDGRVSGRFTFDKEYDGRTITKPQGIIYIVTGGSGATLNRSDDHAYPITLPPFTDKIVNTVHSFTSCQVLGNTLTVRQISEDGKEVDSWVVTK